MISLSIESPLCKTRYTATIQRHRVGLSRAYGYCNLNDTVATLMADSSVGSLSLAVDRCDFLGN